MKEGRGGRVIFSFTCPSLLSNFLVSRKALGTSDCLIETIYTEPNKLEFSVS